MWCRLEYGVARLVHDALCWSNGVYVVQLPQKRFVKYLVLLLLKGFNNGEWFKSNRKIGVRQKQCAMLELNGYGRGGRVIMACGRFSQDPFVHLIAESLQSTPEISILLMIIWRSTNCSRLF